MNTGNLCGLYGCLVEATLQANVMDVTDWSSTTHSVQKSDQKECEYLLQTKPTLTNDLVRSNVPPNTL